MIEYTGPLNAAGLPQVSRKNKATKDATNDTNCERCDERVTLATNPLDGGSLVYLDPDNRIHRHPVAPLTPEQVDAMLEEM